jgi:hypothetical protein
MPDVASLRLRQFPLESGRNVLAQHLRDGAVEAGGMAVAGLYLDIRHNQTVDRKGGQVGKTQPPAGQEPWQVGTQAQRHPGR